MSLKKKLAILLVTNSRFGNIHLYRTAVGIDKKYKLGISFPGEDYHK